MASSLLAIRQRLGRDLDDLNAYTITAASAGPPSTVTIPALIDATSSASSSRYDDAHLYVNSGSGAGQSRDVQPGGFAPSSGVLTLKQVWSTVPSNTHGVEISRLFAAVSGTPGEDTDYRTFIRRALAMIYRESRLAVSVTGGAATASLSTWAFWVRPSLIQRVLEPAAISGGRVREVPAAGWTWFQDNHETFIQNRLPFDANGTATVVALRPMHTRVSVASSWGESTTGPTDDSDEVIPNAEDVAAVARMLALESLILRGVSAPHGSYLPIWEVAREQARAVEGYDASAEVPSEQIAAAAGVPRAA